MLLSFTCIHLLLCNRVTKVDAQFSFCNLYIQPYAVVMSPRTHRSTFNSPTSHRVQHPYANMQMLIHFASVKQQTFRGFSSSFFFSFHILINSAPSNSRICIFCPGFYPCVRKQTVNTRSALFKHHNTSEHPRWRCCGALLNRTPMENIIIIQKPRHY